MTSRARRLALESYLARVLDRDFFEQGHPGRRPAALRTWLAAYAAATATTASYERVRDAATPGEADSPSKPTTTVYREVLTRLWLLDPVPGWLPTRNPFSRLRSSPKHHLADPALGAQLLGATAATLLEGTAEGPPVPRDGTLLGTLFESLVTLSVRVHAEAADARVAHLRTEAGRQEVDLIVERADGKVIGLEVKLSATVIDDDVRHLRWLQTQVGDDLLDAAVITTGSYAYRRTDGIAVIPAALLGP